MEYKEFEKMMKQTKSAYTKANNKLQDLLLATSTEFSDIDLSELESSAENADNVLDAICCYVHHNESNPKQIWDDILIHLM